MLNVDSHAAQCQVATTITTIIFVNDWQSKRAVVADGQWELLKNTAVAGTAVVGIINPANANMSIIYVNQFKSIAINVNQRQSTSINQQCQMINVNQSMSTIVLLLQTVSGSF